MTSLILNNWALINKLSKQNFHFSLQQLFDQTFLIGLNNTRFLQRNM